MKATVSRSPFYFLSSGLCGCARRVKAGFYAAATEEYAKMQDFENHRNPLARVGAMMTSNVFLSITHFYFGCAEPDNFLPKQKMTGSPHKLSL